MVEGTTCKCGTILKDGSVKVDDTKCESPCTADADQYCGGNDEYQSYFIITNEAENKRILAT